MIFKFYFPLVQFLIKNGADVNARAYEDLTPLHLAITCAHLNISKVLIENGANIYAKSPYGTPLQMSTVIGHHDIVEIMIESVVAEKVKFENHDSEENQTIVVDNSCTICANPRNGFYAFLPCGHSIACEVCCAKIFAHARKSQNNKQTVCPCCCLPVTGYQQFYVQ